MFKFTSFYILFILYQKNHLFKKIFNVCMIEQTKTHEIHISKLPTLSQMNPTHQRSSFLPFFYEFPLYVSV